MLSVLLPSQPLIFRPCVLSEEPCSVDDQLSGRSLCESTVESFRLQEKDNSRCGDQWNRNRNIASHAGARNSRSASFGLQCKQTSGTTHPIRTSLSNGYQFQPDEGRPTQVGSFLDNLEGPGDKLSQHRPLKHKVGIGPSKEVTRHQCVPQDFSLHFLLDMASDEEFFMSFSLIVRRVSCIHIRAS